MATFDSLEYDTEAVEVKKARGVENKKLTEEECLKIGGHCWELEPYTLTTDPPISVRKCKHCGKIQHGQEQPSIRWG